LWAGDGAVISYRAAGALWGLDVDAGARPEIWTRRHLRHDDVIVHRGVVEPQDIRMVERIPVTSVPRTLIDLAGRLDGDELETILEQALHRGLTTLGALHRRVEALSGKGRAGSNNIRRLLNERGNSAALESRLEVRVCNLLRSAGWRPRRQYPVQCGGRRYRLDFAWPALRVAVEADGYRTHGGQWFEAHERRRADLAARGWRIVPVTWREVTNEPQRVIDRIQEALRSAAA